MRKNTNKQNPTQEIRQNGRPVLWSNCEFSLSMIFNNLTGRNIPDAKEYNEYIECIAIGDMGFAYGEIELVQNGQVVAKGHIRLK